MHQALVCLVGPEQERGRRGDAASTQASPQPVPLQRRNRRWVLLLQHPGNADGSGGQKFHFQKSKICLQRATAGGSKPDQQAFQITQACPRLGPNTIQTRATQHCPPAGLAWLWIYISLCFVSLRYIFYCNLINPTKQNLHIPHSFKKPKHNNVSFSTSSSGYLPSF